MKTDHCISCKYENLPRSQYPCSSCNSGAMGAAGASSMQIRVSKVTSPNLMRWACALTIDSESNMTLDKIYDNEHSPMRTQIFAVTMLGIPTFVSTHFRTHSQGITHFVKSLREDRGGDGTESRWTPTNHGMLLNAQSLINLSRKRLCHKSHDETRKVMDTIKIAIDDVDSELAFRMVPDCIYRNGCHEDISCGYYRRCNGIPF